MISLQNVSKVYGEGSSAVHAVQDVNLSVERGDIFGIIGYSGAGKSTVLRLLNGLETATTGRVQVIGRDISRASEAELKTIRPCIGIIFQHFNLLWSRTVRANIAMPLQIAGIPKDKIGPRVEELIRLVGLEGRGDAYPSQLSGGQKQRVGIARALANNPDILLCDEATSALDPQTTDQILDLLAEINRDLGLTIVLITHEMHVVRHICNKVAVMELGKVVEQGLVSEIFVQPQSAVTRRFLRQLPDDNAGSPEQGRPLTLIYRGSQAAEPVLSEAIWAFGLPVTILSAHMREVGGQQIGELNIRLGGAPDAAETFMTYLRDRGVQILDEANHA